MSVGEVAVARTLARALPDGLPLVVTTVTPTGQARARASFTGSATLVTYLPFDVGFAVNRFFHRYNPSGLILVEGDYWPLILRAARRRNIPVAVINGRMGERSFGRWQRLRRWLPALLHASGIPSISHFGVQTHDDRTRLRDLGIAAERIHVTGNLKFEAQRPAPLPALEAAVRSRANDRPILVAGSTMQGEDELVLDAFSHLQHGMDQAAIGPALLVLVPRHPERWDAAVGLAESRGLRCERRSSLDSTLDSNAALSGHTPSAERGAAPKAVPDVLLLDSMGELAALYRIADAAFIGGTLVPTGGHNPLEPALFAVPTVVGPSMYNFREMASLFDDAGAWQRVDDAKELAACWATWLRDDSIARRIGDRAEALLVAHRGALDKTRALLKPLLDHVESHQPGDPS